MAAAAVMPAAARSLCRFRGCLEGALLGDCVGVGAVDEARDTADLTSVSRQVQDLEPDPGSSGSARPEALCYTDDTAGRGRGAGAVSAGQGGLRRGGHGSPVCSGV